MKLQSKTKILDLSSAKIMAILNATPDSFSDGGKHLQIEAALNFAQQALDNGAAILDIGGESTRPGAEKVSIDEELSRVIPVIEAIHSRFDCWISIDTSKAVVMKEAVNAGADLINDVCALQQDNSLQIAAQLGVPVCLMHMQGTPENMQTSPSYQDVITQINNFFAERILQCEQAGISKDQILLDPGFGFGKTLEHNYQLLAGLSHFHLHGLPLLVGMSRKSMIFNLMNSTPNDVLGGSIAAATIAAMQGAQIIRVHDVKESFQAIQVVKALNKAKESIHG